MILALLSFVTLANASERLVLESYCTFGRSDEKIECKANPAVQLPQFPTSVKRVEYKFSVGKTEPCVSTDSCWLLLGEVADIFQLKVNGISEANAGISGPKEYLRNKNTIVPIAASHLDRDRNEIALTVEDRNGVFVGIMGPELLLGGHGELFWKGSRWWLREVGLSLFTAVTLAVLFIGFGLAAFFSRDPNYFFLALYAGASAIYHVSFSEITRDLIDPLFASTSLHFTFRFLQDLALLLLLLRWRKDGPRVAWLGIGAYAAAITVLWLQWFVFKQRDYEAYRTSMRWMVCFVGFPVLFGLWTVWRNKDISGRQLLLPFFAIVACGQINDIMVFHAVYRGFFTVRVYPPFIAIAWWLAYLRFQALREAELEASRRFSAMATQVAHDIRGPLASLSSLVGDLGSNSAAASLAQSVSNRIQGICDELLGKYRETLPRTTVVPKIGDQILDLIAEKRVRWSNAGFTVGIDPGIGSLPAPAYLAQGLQALSNLIDNAVEASPPSGFIHISVRASRTSIELSVLDEGPGVSVDVSKAAGVKPLRSQKKNGTGLGLVSVKNLVESIRGSFSIGDRPGGGTAACIKIPVPTYVLVEDDALIREGWARAAARAGATLIQFSDVETVLARIEEIPPRATFFIDEHLRNDFGTHLCEELKLRGFDDLFLQSGDPTAGLGTPGLTRGLIGKTVPFESPLEFTSR